MNVIKSSLIAALMFTCFTFRATAEPETYSAIKVTDDIYILYANVGVVIGEDYVTLIDSWLGHYQKGASDKLVAAVKKLTDKPIRYVINTHSHGDHAGGNGHFIEQGATVIAHKNSVYSPFIPKTGQPQGMLRFDGRFSLDMVSEQLDVEHLVAHTFDDAFIYARQGNVLFVGDNFISTFWVGLGVDGMKSFDRWVDKALSMMDEETLIVPGHGSTIFNRAQLLAYRKAVKAWAAKVYALYDANIALDTILKDKTVNALFAQMIPQLDSPHRQMTLNHLQELIVFKPGRFQSVSLERLSKHIGVYQHQDRGDIELAILQGKLVAKQKDKFYSFLEPVKNSQFELTAIGEGERFDFTFNSRGEVTGFYTAIPEASRYQSLRTARYWQKK